MLQRGVVDDDNEWEPVGPITSPCVSGYWGLSSKKPSEIGYPVPLCAGGAQFSPHTSHVIRKQTVNATFATSHQADPAHCYKFHILQWICSTQYFTILFSDWGRRRKPGSVPGDTVTATWDRRKRLEGSLTSPIHTGCLRDADVFPLHLWTHQCWRHGFMTWRWCHTCTSSPLTPPQFRGGHLLHPVGLATVICQFLVILALRLVAMADSPGSGLPDIRFLSLCYVNVVDVLYGLDSRKAFNTLASLPPADCCSWDRPTATSSTGPEMSVLPLWCPVDVTVSYVFLISFFYAHVDDPFFFALWALKPLTWARVSNFLLLLCLDHRTMGQVTE
jgi:hypothetical protein